EIAALERDVATMEAEVERIQTALRFDDPWTAAQRVAVDEYSAFLDRAFAALQQAKPNANAQKVWDRTNTMRARVAAGRGRLDNAAGKRLRRAMQILREERVNLDNYAEQLTG